RGVAGRRAHGGMKFHLQSWLQLGCSSRRDLPRFARSRSRNIEYFWLKRALRNQQVAGSSPAAGSIANQTLLSHREIRSLPLVLIMVLLRSSGLGRLGDPL